MANEQNLRPVRTSEEAKKRGRNGGLASQAKARERRSMRETAAMLMALPLRGDETVEELQSFADAKARRNSNGDLVTPNLTVGQAVVITQVKEALNGSVQAANFLADILGEKSQKIEISQTVDEGVKEMAAYFEAKKEQEEGSAKKTKKKE